MKSSIRWERGVPLQNSPLPEAMLITSRIVKIKIMTMFTMKLEPPMVQSSGNTLTMSYKYNCGPFMQKPRTKITLHL